jgi:hypothetical protein
VGVAFRLRLLWIKGAICTAYNALLRVNWPLALAIGPWRPPLAIIGAPATPAPAQAKGEGGRSTSPLGVTSPW